jgi:hypothetical protein
LISLVAAAGVVAGATSGDVPYPEGYRSWAHVKSMVIEPGHALYDAFGGIHHVYANGIALEAMKARTTPFPDGSVLVFDLLEVKSDANAVTEGARKVVGVMAKDSRRFVDTGGWGFEGFQGDGRERVVSDAAAQCFGCHAPQKDSDFVFSTYRR